MPSNVRDAVGDAAMRDDFYRSQEARFKGLAGERTVVDKVLLTGNDEHFLVVKTLVRHVRCASACGGFASVFFVPLCVRWLRVCRICDSASVVFAIICHSAPVVGSPRHPLTGNDEHFLVVKTLVRHVRCAFASVVFYILRLLLRAATPRLSDV